MLSDKIKQARLEANLSKAEVARKLQIPYTTYDGYERGYRQPPIEIIPKIADILGVSPYDLMGWNDLIEKASKMQGTVNEAVQAVSDAITAFSNMPKPSILAESAYKTIKLLSESFNKLNTVGQAEAVKRVEELTEIPRYQKDPSDQDDK